MSKIIRLPGLIDIHVHLRDPGQTDKEDFYSGTSAALAGGVTSVFDMPNNLEPIFTQEKLLEKIAIAKQKAVCDWGLYFGSVGDNIAQFNKIAAKVVGLKVYLSVTTGKYVVGDEEVIKVIFKNWPKEKIIVFHAEGDRVDLVIKLTEKFANKVHLTHINTKESLEKIIGAKKDKLPLTCDITPHHLFLDNTSEVLYSNVKPALAKKNDQNFLWENLKWVDCLASDHAPHTVEEKQSDNPPPGVPGLETMLPLLLTAAKQGRISIIELIRLTSDNPRKIFGLKKIDKTYSEVDPDEEYIIDNSHLFTKCGWSPFHGWTVKGKVIKTLIRGKTVFENGKISALPGFGKSVK